MSIQELSTKLKGFCTNSEIVLVFIIVGTAVTSFMLGRLSVEDKALPVAVSQNQPAQAISPQLGTSTESAPNASNTPAYEPVQPVSAEVPTPEVVYVGSKNGTKYHLLWCAGAKQIKEENKVFFASKQEAEKSGYTPASNCKGI